MKGTIEMVRWYQWMVAVCATLFSAAAFAELPDRFVEYVESTNKTTYVDTGIAGSPANTRMFVRLAVTAQTTTQSGVFGAATGDGGNNASESFSYASKKFRADWTGSSTDTGITPAVGDVYDIECRYSFASVGDKTVVPIAGNTNHQKGGSNANALYLFNYNRSGVPYSNGGVLQRVYSCRIWADGTTLSANLVPCEKDGVAGFWDSVSGTILYPANCPLVASASDNPGVKVENGSVYALLAQTNDDANGALAAAGSTWVAVGAAATISPTPDAGLQPEYTTNHEGFKSRRTYAGASLAFAMPAWPVEVAVAYSDATCLPRVHDLNPYIAAASSGDTLRLASGTYTLSEPINLTNGVSLAGQGKDETILTPEPNLANRLVYMTTAASTLKDLAVLGCTNNLESGNSVYMTAGTLDGVRVGQGFSYKNNSWKGVGIYMAGGTVTNCLVDSNVVMNSGNGAPNGIGIYINGAALVVDSEITGNGRDSGEVKGCGVYVNGAATVRDCRITGNWSPNPAFEGCGGCGFMMDNQNAVIERCVVASNAVSGAIVNSGTVRNCLIYGHASTKAGFESGVYLKGDKAKFYNNTVAGNTSVTAFSGLRMTNGTAANNIIYGNGTGGDISVSGGTFRTNIVGVAAYTGGTASDNLATDPFFTDAENADYTIGFNSPAVDAGVAITGVSTDIVGTERPKGAAFDIGAYEYVPDASTLQAAVVVAQGEYGTADTAGATARAAGGSGSYVYAWYLDGTLLEGETGAALSIPASEIGTGHHTIRLVVTDAADETLSAEHTYANAWTVKPTTVYVSTTGSDTYPYDTVEKAARSFEDAVDALYVSSTAESEVVVGEGTFDCATAISMATPITIRGAGREATALNFSGLASSYRAFAISHASAVLKDLTVTGCTNSLTGATIYMTANARVENVRSTCNALYTTGSGNGIYGVGLYMSAGTATNCVFDSNAHLSSSGSGDGVGLYISGGLAVDCEIYRNVRLDNNGNNRGEAKGVGAFVNNTGKLLRCNIHENGLRIKTETDSSNYGMGLYLNNASSVAENCVIWSNGVQGVWIGAGTLCNSLVWGHKTSHESYPSGVRLNGSSAGLYNCTIAGNTAMAAANADLLMTAGTAKNNIAVAATVSGGTSANNLFNVNPNFKNALAGNFRLSAGSLAIDAGDNDAWSGLAASCDLDGNDRIKRKVVDIGCYEYNGTGLLIFVR